MINVTMDYENLEDFVSLKTGSLIMRELKRPEVETVRSPADQNGDIMAESIRSFSIYSRDRTSTQHPSA